MSSQPTASNCPNCNAPLNLENVPLTQTQVKCEYCGSIVNIRDRAAPTLQQTIIINAPPAAEDYAQPTVTVRRVSGLAGLAFACIPLVIIGAVLYFTFNTVNRAMDTATSSISKVVDVPKVFGDLPKVATASALGSSPFGNPTVFYQRGDGLPPDLISVMREEKDVNRLLSYDFKSKTPRWKGDVLSKDYYNAHIVPGKGLLFVNDDTKLSAYNADTGATAWSVSLASAPPTNCEPCVRAVGDQVVSFGRDGTLQAFDAATGKPAWTKRLDPFGGKPLDVAGRLVVGDAISPTRPTLGQALVVMDPATGETKQRIEASCVMAGQRAYPRNPDRFYFSPDGNSVYVLFAGSDGGAGGAGCAQRYDLNTGKQAWSLNFKTEDVFPFSIASWVSVLAANDALYVLDDSQSSGVSLNIVDAATGKPRHFTLDKQYRMKLKDANADAIIIEASPKFDSQRTEYWGVNPATGERKWQFVLDKGTRLDSSTARLTKQGFIVLQCGDNPDKSGETRCAFDHLDPKTGVSSGQVKHDLRGTSLGLKPKWSDDNVWVINYARALGLGLGDGKAQYDAP